MPLINWIKVELFHCRPNYKPTLGQGHVSYTLDDFKRDIDAALYHRLLNMSRLLSMFINIQQSVTVDLVVFACLHFREFVILRLSKKSKIRQLSMLMIGRAHIIVIFAIPKFANLSSSRNSLKFKRGYYLPTVVINHCFTPKGLLSDIVIR